MQMAFYTGSMFPAEYRNDAFVAMRGSWNRKPPSGYEVVRVRFDASGRPTAIAPFLTGFLVPNGAPDGKDGQFARLAGVAVARDGALLVSDDTNNTIYRVSYGAEPRGSMAGRNMLTSMLPEGRAAQGVINVRSDAFAANQPIPEANSAYGQDLSPALSWSGVPAGAKSVVLMMEDPDASGPKPFVHWLVANLPANVTSLPASLPKTESPSQLAGAMQGANHTGRLGYYGPHPPSGEPPHRYHFQIFALDTVLRLPAGFNRHALIEAMRGHMLAKGELVGTYQRRP